MTSLAYLDCERFDPAIGKHSDQYFMRIDYSTECYTRKYYAWGIYYGSMMLVYPIGIPLIYYIYLRKHYDAIDPVIGTDSNGKSKRARMKISKEDVETAVKIRSRNADLKPLGFLFDAYEPEFWWWEIEVCVSRVLLTNVSKFFNGNAELVIYVVLTIVMIKLKLVSQLDPYLEDADDILAECGEYVSVALLVFSIMYTCDELTSSTGFVEAVLNILLSALLLFFVIVCSVAMFYDDSKYADEELKSAAFLFESERNSWEPQEDQDEELDDNSDTDSVTQRKRENADCDNRGKAANDSWTSMFEL